MYSSGFGFHFYRQSFHGYDLYGFSFIHERIAGRTPIFAFHKDFSAARIDRGKRVSQFFPPLFQTFTPGLSRLRLFSQLQSPVVGERCFLWLPIKR
jgi:hypothetical protein